MSELLKEITKNTDREKQRRISKARNDFFYFCRTYLSRYFSHDTAEYQKILIDIANSRSLNLNQIESLKKFVPEKYQALMKMSEKLEMVVDIEPRGFSKSTRWSFAYPLWQLLFAKSKFICLFCATQEAANAALQNIKDEIESNELLYEDFGKVEGSNWTAKFLTLKNGTAIKAFGAGVAVRGARYKENRPDLIICDDVLKDENARTYAQRQKIYDWFVRAVLPLGKEIFTIVINTIFHDDDLPSRLLKRIQEEQLENWVGFRFRAITESNESLWPEYWPLEKLLAKKKQLGTAAFTTEYMNEPLSEEERTFKPEWFVRYNSVDVQALRVFMGVDPSMGKHDEFAIFTLGFSSQDNKIYMLDEWAEACSVDRSVNKLIEKYLMFKPILIGFEEVAFQLIYKKYIMEKSAQKNVYLPIKGMKTNGVGKERILSLSPLIENGMVLWKYGLNKTIGQLTMYPKSEYDDLQDAFYYAWAVGNGSGAKSIVSSKIQNARNLVRSVFK